MSICPKNKHSKARRDSRRDSLFMDMCRQIEFIDGEGA